MKIDSLNLNQAHHLAQLAVEKRGSDFVYRNLAEKPVADCHYFHGDEPGCVVGQMLYMVGYRPNDVTEGMSASQVAQNLLGVDNDTARFLDQLQGAQDEGHCWGVALQHAVEFIRDVKGCEFQPLENTDPLLIALGFNTEAPVEASPTVSHPAVLV